jgi:tRNA(adenine34) deaminase
MREALKQAQEAFQKDEVPIGAIIVYKDKIIAKAHNQVKLLKDPTAHAEIIAITQAANYFKNERLLDTSLYVTLEPCAMCVGALILARVKKLIFAACDPKSGVCGSVVDLTNAKLFNHRLEVKSGVLEEESALLLKEFFKKKRK